MHAEANGHPQQARSQAHNGELERVAPRNRALALAQHAQHRAVVQVRRRKCSRRQCDCYGAEQGRQQRHQVQELLGAVQRLPHLGPAAFERLDSHASYRRLLDLFQRPLHELRHTRVRPRHCEAIADTAGRLHQLCCSNIGRVDHHARCKAHEARATIGLDGDHAREAKGRVAQQKRVANLQADGVQQRCIHPGFAACRNVTGVRPRLLGLRCDLEVASQRVARRNGLQRNQARPTALCITRPCHRRKADRGYAFELELARFGKK